MRGATAALGLSCTETTFLLTRPMRGATLTALLLYRRSPFLLTRPMRGATHWDFYLHKVFDISTHTPHAGRDRETIL